MQSNKLSIFVSYAHDDDAILLDEHNKGWVSRLIDKLTIVLGQKIGGQIHFEIWQDRKKLFGDNELNQAIYDALNKADIFIMILSPCYLNSSWCQKELNYFIEKMPIKDITRIFVIEKDKIDRKDRPVCIKELIGFPFWKQESPEKSSITIGAITPDLVYYQKINDIAERIKRKFDPNKLSENNIQSLIPRSKIYLATVTKDLYCQYEEIKRFLISEDYHVVPEINILEMEHDKTFVRQSMLQSKVYVQLISSIDDKLLNNKKDNCVLQYKCACELNIPVLIWSETKLEPNQIHNNNDDEYKNLIFQARTENIESFKQEILRTLKPKPVQKYFKAKTAINNKPSMPYPGLRPFTREESPIFFGFDEQISDLLEKLSNKRFIAVIGPSGSGKSSLVQAGLIPAVEDGSIKITTQPWRIAIMTPDVYPMENLRNTLCDILELDQDRDEYHLILDTLNRGPSGLLHICRKYELTRHSPLLLVVDQFEEIFRFRQYNSINKAEAFVNLVIHSSRQKKVPIYVVIILRSDYLSDCTLFQDLPLAMNDSQFFIPRLTRSQRKQAIENPAQLFGLKVCSNLVNILLNEMSTNPDQLPIMQHVLRHIWKIDSISQSPELTLNTYERIGTFADALSNHAESAYNELSSKQKQIAEVLFKSMCEISQNHKDIRRSVSITEVSIIAKSDVQDVIEVVNKFRIPDRSFIRPPIEKKLKPTDIIDLSHESLIRQWKRLDEWAKEEEKSAEIYQLLANRAEKGHSYYRSPELDTAWDWMKANNPSPEWAKRYCKDYQSAMAFLKKSKLKQRIENFIRRLFFVLLLGVFIFTFWTISEKRQANQNSFEILLNQSIQYTKIQDFYRAKLTLKDTLALNSDINYQRQYARNFLKWYVHTMSMKSDCLYKNKGLPLLEVAICPDGKFLAAYGENPIILLLDETTGKEIHSFKGHTDNIRSILFHPDGNLLLSGGLDKNIIIWSLNNFKKLKTINAPGKVLALAVHPEGHLLASAETDESISIWDIDTYQIIKHFDGHEAIITDIEFSPNGKWLASSSKDKKIRIWDTKNFTMKKELIAYTSKVKDISFHPDSEQLIIGKDTQILLWNYVRNVTTIYKGHIDQINSLKFLTTENPVFISASKDNTLRLWDIDSGIPLHIMNDNQGIIYDIDTNNKHIYSASEDGTVRRWPTSNDSIQILDVNREPWSCALTLDGQKLAIGYSDGTLDMYSISEPFPVTIWQKESMHKDGIQRIFIMPNSNYLLTASFDHSAKLIETLTGKTIRCFRGHVKNVYAAVVSPTEKIIATASYDGRIGLFNTENKFVTFTNAHDHEVYSVNFDSTGRYLISSGEDGKTKLWQINNEKLYCVKEMPKSQEKVMWTTFSPDGKKLVSVGKDLLIHIFDRQTANEIVSLDGHENTIYKAIFSPDSNYLVSVSSDATIRVWDVVTQTCLLTLRLPAHSGLPSPLWDFDFKCTPDGNCKLVVPLISGRILIYIMKDLF